MHRWWMLVNRLNKWTVSHETCPVLGPSSFLFRLIEKINRFDMDPSVHGTVCTVAVFPKANWTILARVASPKKYLISKSIKQSMDYAGVCWLTPYEAINLYKLYTSVYGRLPGAFYTFHSCFRDTDPGPSAHCCLLACTDWQSGAPWARCMTMSHEFAVPMLKPRYPLRLKIW